jgi:hypothetical protein
MFLKVFNQIKPEEFTKTYYNQTLKYQRLEKNFESRNRKKVNKLKGTSISLPAEFSAKTFPE